MKAIIFDSAKCSGCYACQIACKDEHSNNNWKPIAAAQPDTGQFWCNLTQTTHGQIPKVRVEYKPLFCNHCEKASCIDAAPDCVYRREDGLVIIDPEKAVGHKELMEACPYGAIYWNDELNLAQKCTGCAHLVDEGRIPHCVEVCATKALRFGDESELAEEIAQAVRVTSVEHGGHVYYLNLPGLFISGDVWDPEIDEIVEDAKVTLIGADGKVLDEQRTDGFGDFWFKKLELGKYTVKVEAQDYVIAEKQVDLVKSLNIGDFALKHG